jgi:putative tryptophan/tyrosine transport system substrate-binding protein
MKRREFIALFGGAAVSYPTVAGAQQERFARIGFLGLDSASSHAPRVSALRAGLRDQGYVEGRNLLIEFRWANGDYSRAPFLARELVFLNVDVLVTHGAAGALAAQKATSTIPIVITAVGDMITLGLISSLARPGGNITGISLFVSELTAKRLELVKDIVPTLTKAAVLLNPDNASTRLVLQEVEGTARSLKIELTQFEARHHSELEPVFATMADQQMGAVVVHEDTMLNVNSKMIANLAMAKRMPSSGFPEFARTGGLIAYGVNFPETDYRAATFIQKILKGAKASDLPIERSTKFTVTVNLKTAGALGLAVPATLLTRADELIE